jgi:hypothetical protein
MSLYSAFTLPGDGTRPAFPSTFTSLAFTPDGFNPTSADVSKRTGYWEDSAGTMTEDDVLLAIKGLDSFKAAQIQALSVPYQAALQTPVSYMGTVFDADAQSQIIVAHAMLVYGVAGRTPDGFYFTDSSSAKVPMTLEQLQGLGAAISDNYLPVFQHWTDLKAQVMAAATLAEVQAVVW